MKTILAILGAIVILAILIGGYVFLSTMTVASAAFGLLVVAAATPFLYAFLAFIYIKANPDRQLDDLEEDDEEDDEEEVPSREDPSFSVPLQWIFVISLSFGVGLMVWSKAQPTNILPWWVLSTACFIFALTAIWKKSLKEVPYKHRALLFLGNSRPLWGIGARMGFFQERHFTFFGLFSIRGPRTLERRDIVQKVGGAEKGEGKPFKGSSEGCRVTIKVECRNRKVYKALADNENADEMEETIVEELGKNLVAHLGAKQVIHLSTLVTRVDFSTIVEGTGIHPDPSSDKDEDKVIERYVVSAIREFIEKMREVLETKVYKVSILDSDVNDKDLVAALDRLIRADAKAAADKLEAEGTTAKKKAEVAGDRDCIRAEGEATAAANAAIPDGISTWAPGGNAAVQVGVRSGGGSGRSGGSGGSTS